MGNNWIMEGYPEKLSDSLMMQLSGIKWVIIGAQTNPYKPPKIEWVEEIVEACDKVGIPVFLKDNLRPLLPAVSPFITNPLRDFEFNLRQEMPE